MLLLPLLSSLQDGSGKVSASKLPQLSLPPVGLSHLNGMTRTNILPRSSSASSLFSLLLLLQHAIFYSFVLTKVEGNECRLVMEKNEWAAGCIPAVNFVVKCKSWVFLLAILYIHSIIPYHIFLRLPLLLVQFLYFDPLFLTISGRLWRCSNVRFFPHLNQRRNIYAVI